jgi:micrococcal nuclease
VRIEALPPLLHVVERVRFLGVDTPETVDPRKAVQEYGEAAYLFTKRSIEKSYIFLAFDWDLRDQYGRILAYVYVENGLCFNTILLQRGYAYAYTRYPFQFLDEFKAHEMAARNNKVGLWR